MVSKENFKIAIGCIWDGSNWEELKQLLDSFILYNKNVFYNKPVIDDFICITGPFRYFVENKDKYDEYDNCSSYDHISDYDELYSKNRIKLEEYFEDHLDQKCNLTFSYSEELEYIKRNEYLKICDKLKTNVLLIVDSDEYFNYPDKWYLDSANSKGNGENKSLMYFRTQLYNKYKKMENFIELYQVNPEDFKLSIDKFSNLPLIAKNIHLIDHVNIDDGSSSVAHRPRIWFNPSDMTYAYNSHYYYYNFVLENDIINYYNKYNVRYCQPHSGSIYHNVDSEVSVLNKSYVELYHSKKMRSEYENQKHKDYMTYLEKYESLVQNGFDFEESHHMAKHLKFETVNKIVNKY